MSRERRIPFNSTGDHLRQLSGRDADWPVERYAGAGQQSAEQIALVGLDLRQKTSGFERAAALAGDDERKVLPGMRVAILKTGTPHHDAVVEQGAVPFAQAVHSFDHVRELGNVERVDLGDLVDFRDFVVVMGAGVVLV
jgi:hypothetical protein